VQVRKQLVGEPGDPTSVGRGENGRPYREVKGRTPRRNGRGKSDSPTVATNWPNQAEGPAAEAREGRELGEGNSPERNALRTQGRESPPSALERVRQAASKGRKQRFTALLHHIYEVERLRAASLGIKKDAAAGVDGQTWEHNGETLEANLQDLSHGLKRGAYRARPVHRVYIPKVGKPGELRPLEVPAPEDKMAQRVSVEVWNAIYEQDFLGFSYGFRAGRSPHQVLDALAVGIGTRKVNWVLDADIRKFYDTLDQGWLVKFIEHRIADRRVVRPIQKWLKAGVLEEGKRVRSEIGTVQGGSISSLRWNIYRHDTLDLWVQRWRQKQAHGEVIFVRFADDCVAGFEHRYEAERFLAELRERFAKFGGERHADKTRIVEFSRHAEQNRRNRGDGKPETFNFLGFTHRCGKTWKDHFTVLRQTMRQRWQAKLRALKEELRRRLHTPVREQGAYVRAVLLGQFRYYGVPRNGPALCAFRKAVGSLWRTVLRRRSQGNHLPWRRMQRFITRWFPSARVCHPYPLVRLGVLTQGGSRMR